MIAYDTNLLLSSIDYIGTIVFLGFMTSLSLALQWGGNAKPWNSADVISTLVGALN